MSVSKKQGRFIGSDKDLDPRHSEDEKQLAVWREGPRTRLRE